MNNRIRIARGTSDKRKTSTETLVKGQLFLETDTQVLYNTSTDSERELKNATPINISDTSKIGVNSTSSRTPNDIFEENSNTVKDATNVTSKINDKNISDIFEDDGVTVKKSNSIIFVTDAPTEETVNNLAENQLIVYIGSTLPSTRYDKVLYIIT